MRASLLSIGQVSDPYQRCTLLQICSIPAELLDLDTRPKLGIKHARWILGLKHATRLNDLQDQRRPGSHPKRKLSRGMYTDSMRSENARSDENHSAI